MRNGQVVVGPVVTAQPGWVDIHAEAETAGNPGPVIARFAVADSGRSEPAQLDITIHTIIKDRWQQIALSGPGSCQTPGRIATTGSVQPALAGAPRPLAIPA
jgi:hypothetical protein